MFEREKLTDEQRAKHRKLAKDLFNFTWTLIEAETRTPERDDAMVHAAHASCFHWSLVGEPENFAIGEWQCSRVYALLGRAEPARRHARRNLELCEEHGLDGFVLAFAYEGLARAAAVAGDADGRAENLGLAEAAAEQIADPKEREMLLADLGTV